MPADFLFVFLLFLLLLRRRRFVGNLFLSFAAGRLLLANRHGVRQNCLKFHITIGQSIRYSPLAVRALGALARSSLIVNDAPRSA